ncbi:hypothetical protein JZ751_016757 [Albula glossodonta]|uniref:Uncharacterized protein n=1 Tax=Albula glossodonta TaxID=121402 RepID=A0A8T2NPG8_9TELE|nr:hypothetical protein JZ751_016757 [Albula glossodonta]
MMLITCFRSIKSLALPSNYTALVGVWIYGFFVMVLLALDFLYYSAMNYELCRVYLEKWGLGGRWLKQARSQWNSPLQGDTEPPLHPIVLAHHPRHSLRGDTQSPSLMSFHTSTACDAKVKAVALNCCCREFRSRGLVLPGVSSHQVVTRSSAPPWPKQVYFRIVFDTDSAGAVLCLTHGNTSSRGLEQNNPNLGATPDTAHH